MKALSSSSWPRFFPLSLPGVWREIRPHPFTTTSVPKLFFTWSLAWDPFTATSVPKLIFLFPISADRRRGLFLLWDSSQSFGFYLLPSPVRWFVRATICPCTPFFTHRVTECKHLLVSILTWICYLRNWPRFLFQRSVLGLLIQIQRNSNNPLFLFSQWETMWQQTERLTLDLHFKSSRGFVGREGSNFFLNHGWLCFYSISTLLCNLMPNPVYTYIN